MAAVVVSGAFVLGGVLLGAVVTHIFTRRSEMDRLAADDERRWLNDRRTIYSRYLGLCERMLLQIDGIGCFLSYDGSEPISDEDEQAIGEGLLDFHIRWDDELQPILSEVQLMATPAVSDLGDRTSFALMELTAPIEQRQPFVDYYPMWFQARDLLQVLRNAMRTELGLLPVDVGPVRDPSWPWLADRPSRDSYIQSHPTRRPRF